MIRISQVLPLAVTVVFSPLLQSGNWPNFRGPNFDGSNRENNLPTVISKNEAVKWKSNLKGTGSSTPVVWDDSVFVTVEESSTKGINAVRLNAKTGGIIWKKQFCDSRIHDRRSSLTGPSPATDGKRIIFLSGSGNLACFDFEGELLWNKDLQNEYGEFSLKWTYSSSPMLFRGKLYLQILQSIESRYEKIPGNPSWLIALDPDSGAEIWKHRRSSPAIGQSQEAYSSPIPMVHLGNEEILVSGADCLTSHSAETGTEIRRWETWNRNQVNHWRTIPSPVSGDDMIIACAPKGEPVYSFFAGNRASVRRMELKWTSKRPDISCDVTTPLYYDGFLYFVNGRKKIVSCVEPFSGQVEWLQTLPARSKIEASPSGADNKIFIISHAGEVFILKAGPKYQLIHSTILGQDPEATNRAAVVPANGRLFIRTGSYLWCMEKGQ